MATDPRSWAHNLFGAALLVLAAAGALYITAKLILAVMPVLIGTAVVIFVGLIGHQLMQHRRSRW